MSDPAIQFALGVAGHAATQFDFSQIQYLQDRLREFPEAICRKHSMVAVRKAAKVGRAALENRVGRLGQKTGNLKRAITIKTKWYRNAKSGGLPIAVAVIGYRRSGTGDSKKVPGGQIRIGNDRAFHSHLVEFGTARRFPGKSKAISRNRLSMHGRKTTRVERIKERVDPNEYAVMSSWTTSGPFSMSGGQTQPKYPLAFFAKIDPRKGLGAMPALHPVQRAFESSRTAMGLALQDAMQQAIERAMKQMRKLGE